MRELLLLIAVFLLPVVPEIGRGADGDLDDLKKTPWTHKGKSEPDRFEILNNGRYKVRFSNSITEIGSIKVDGAANPKTIDLIISTPGPDHGKVRKGLYVLKAGEEGKTELHMYFGKPGEDRPKEIKNQSEDSNTLWVMQR